MVVYRSISNLRKHGGFGSGSLDVSVPLVTATTEPETIVPPRIRSLLPTRGFIGALPPEICSLPPEMSVAIEFRASSRSSLRGTRKVPELRDYAGPRQLSTVGDLDDGGTLNRSAALGPP
jgi:hypothetical protein